MLEEQQIIRLLQELKDSKVLEGEIEKDNLRFTKEFTDKLREVIENENVDGLKKQGLHPIVILTAMIETAVLSYPHFNKSELVGDLRYIFMIMATILLSCVNGEI